MAQRIEGPATEMVTKAICLAGLVWFTSELPKVRAAMRSIYQETGLLPSA